jgi:hypothetical protein
VEWEAVRGEEWEGGGKRRNGKRKTRGDRKATGKEEFRFLRFSNVKTRRHDEGK